MILDKIWIDHFFVISDKFFCQSEELFENIFFNRFTHENTFKIMYFSILYPQEPSMNDPGQNLDPPFFRHF